MQPFTSAWHSPARFFALGLAAQTVQMLLVRDLFGLANGGEWAAALLFALWMASGAVGSAWGGWESLRQTDRAQLAWRATVTFAVLAPWLLTTVRAARLVIAVPVGDPLPIGLLGLVAFVAAAPVALLTGTLFPLFLTLPSPAGAPNRNLPVIGYAWEAAGAAAAGGLLATGLLIRWNPFTLCAWALLFLTAITFAASGRGNEWHAATTKTPCRPRCCTTAVMLALYLALLGGGGRYLDRLTLTWACHGYAGDEAQLLDYRNSAHGTIAAVAYQEQISLYQSGALLFTLTRQGEMAPYVHTGLLQHPRPDRILLVNGAYSGFLPELLRHPVQAIDCVEADPAVDALAEQFAPVAKRLAWGDPRVTVIFADSRRFIRNATRRYDLIFVVPGEPLSVAANRLYTRECFRELHNLLTDGGVLVFGPVSAASGYTEPVLLARNRSLWATLQREFSQVSVTAGSAPLFLAANAQPRLSLDPATITERLAERQLPLTDFSWLLDLLAVARVAGELRTGERFDPLAAAPLPGEQTSAAAAEKIPVNSDIRPAGSLLTGLMWGTLLQDKISLWLSDMVRFHVLFWLLPFFVAVLVAWAPSPRHWNQRLRYEVATVSLGFWGAAVQWLILISLQSSFGALYRWVGALTGTFMFGVAAGAWYASRAAAPAHWVKPILCLALAWGWLAGLFPILTAICLGDCPEFGRVSGHLFLSLITGGCVGAGFAAVLAAWHQVDRTADSAATAPASAALLYTLDLLGGLLGMLLTACVILPGHGVLTAAAIAAGAVALALLGLAAPR